MRDLPGYFLLVVSALILIAGSPARAVEAEVQPTVIVTAPEPSFLEDLAAREVRRYTYLRTGKLLPICTAAKPLPNAIIIAPKDRPLARATVQETNLTSLAPQSYWVKTATVSNAPALLLTGGDELGTLYAAYRFAEHLGVRFYLHGDVVPDGQIPLCLPATNDCGKPLFGLRGIQPFHDFPEGPDWWNRDDYLAIISQLPKLRMNFIGLHTYPEGRPNAEPTTWIGLPEDIDQGGRVKFSYPASYHNTLRGNWGYQSQKTSDYSFGAANLFERDDFGSTVMQGYAPEPSTPEACNEVFDRAARLLHDAFAHAHQLGVKTCVGTETPLVIPRAVALRLQQKGKSLNNPTTIQELYEGMFRRITQSYDLDYFWFWTPEHWTWAGARGQQLPATQNDLGAALAAYQKTRPPFCLATSGWVLGPDNDVTLFDKILPKSMPVSCINRETGFAPVDSGFTNINGRSKWAIPWMEDDPALILPQLWVRRARRDAKDALRYGCDGLMGIHWRTRVIGPAISALSQAAWDQNGWSERVSPLPKVEGPIGGDVGLFATLPPGAEDPMVYQTIRFNLSAYNLKLTNGTYTVTLKFIEPIFQRPNRRVFDLSVQGQIMLCNFDLYAIAGNNSMDVPIPNVRVDNGWLEIRFYPRMEFPCIAGIVIEGPGYTRRINCGGLAVGNFEADLPAASDDYTLPSAEDFYADWALHQFGPEIAKPAAELFNRVDSRLPRPAEWIDGPGNIRPDARSWDRVRADYDFVTEFEKLSPSVKGAGNQDRYDYWRNSFCYLRAVAMLNCTWGQLNNAMAFIETERDPVRRKEMARAQALPLLCQMNSLTSEIYGRMLSMVSNSGELGTFMNWERLLSGVLITPGQRLERVLGEPLPPQAQPSKEYTGPTRLIVPAIQTSLAQGEDFSVKAIVLSKSSVKKVTVYWRPLGSGSFKEMSLNHVARGVYSVQLPAENVRDDFEYYVKATVENGAPVVFPAGAPEAKQTVVVTRATRQMANAKSRK